MTLLLSCLFAVGVQAQAPLPLMPLPAQVKPGDGEFLINSGFGITFEGFQEEPNNAS
jgi:hypothetical protein